MIGNLVSHDFHNVETVGAQPERNGQGENGELPRLDGEFGGSGITGFPSGVNDSPRSDRVSDIVGTVGERSGTGSDDLDERVRVFDLVGVFFSVRVDLLHSSTFRSTGDTSLRGVNVVVNTVHEPDDDLGGDSLEDGFNVVELVDGTRTSSVGVQVSHGPSEGTLVSSHLDVETFLRSGELFLVREFELVQRCLRLRGSSLFLRADRSLVFDVAMLGQMLLVSLLVVFGIVLDDGVVRHGSEVGTVDGCGSSEEERTLEGVVPLDRRVSLDDLGVDVRDKEQRGEDGHAETDTENDGSDVPSGLLVQSEFGRTLVHDGKGAHSRSDEEEKGRSVNRPRDGVSSDVDDQLDEHECNRTEASGDGRGHTETGENSSQSVSLVPSPFDILRAGGRNPDSRDGGNERVGGRDVGRVSSTPHDPGGSTGEGTSKGEHLHTGIVSESSDGDDSVFNRGSGSRSD